MYIKLIFKQTIYNKQLYSLRLYKYRDSYFLCTVHPYSTRLRFGITYTHPIRTDTHT